MKNNKFNVVWLNEDGSVNRNKEYKSFREIEADLKLDYHVIRELNKISDGTITRKFLHPNLNIISKKIKIYSIIKSLV
jgi:hypothetical protein